MRKLSKDEYHQFVQEIKDKIYTAQYETSKVVNTYLITLFREISWIKHIVILSNSSYAGTIERLHFVSRQNEDVRSSMRNIS